MKILQNVILSLVFCACTISLSAQPYEDVTKKNPFGVLNLGLSYGINVSLADLGDRFGSNFGIGVDLEKITANNSLIFGINTRYYFGSTVKENTISNLIQNDFVLGIDGQYASIFTRQRGLKVDAVFGKIIAFGKNKKSGLRVSGSLGYLTHWIRFQDDSQTVLQVAGLYQAGYDRLTAGFSISQFIGWQHMSPDGRLNIFGGFEFVEGFTSNQRALNYDTQTRDDERRFDMLAGFRVGLILPFYNIGKGGSDEEIFY